MTKRFYEWFVPFLCWAETLYMIWIAENIRFFSVRKSTHCCIFPLCRKFLI
jgi:hypothetical protein